MSHTPEPWYYVARTKCRWVAIASGNEEYRRTSNDRDVLFIDSAEERRISEWEGDHGTARVKVPSDEDLARIVACVNFCGGFSTEWLHERKLVEIQELPSASELPQVTTSYHKLPQYGMQMEQVMEQASCKNCRYSHEYLGKTLEGGEEIIPVCQRYPPVWSKNIWGKWGWFFPTIMNWCGEWESK